MSSQHRANPQTFRLGLIGSLALEATALLVVMPAAAQDNFTHGTENTIAIAEPHVLHIFEYSLPGQTVLLEFSQDQCRASVTEEYIIPDVPADPSKPALSMLFDALCDLGFSAADTAHSPSGSAPREIIEEILVSPDSLLMFVKFAAG